ncbi:hypothetical protein H9P43_006564 [Blastocladiella emersonii ATCC 22665]|nr:hypothetical protein H9P43_006564 [Blastocladiella emersonii ATCC 22665]
MTDAKTTTAERRPLLDALELIRTTLGIKISVVKDGLRVESGDGVATYAYKAGQPVFVEFGPKPRPGSSSADAPSSSGTAPRDTPSVGAKSVVKLGVKLGVKDKGKASVTTAGVASSSAQAATAPVTNTSTRGAPESAMSSKGQPQVAIQNTPRGAAVPSPIQPPRPTGAGTGLPAAVTKLQTGQVEDTEGRERWYRVWAGEFSIDLHQQLVSGRVMYCASALVRIHHNNQYKDDTARDIASKILKKAGGDSLDGVYKPRGNLTLITIEAFDRHVRPALMARKKGMYKCVAPGTLTKAEFDAILRNA